MDKAFELYNYAKSLIGVNTSYNERKSVWTSAMLFFEHERKIYLDKAILITGEGSPQYYSYFINFSNWEIITNSRGEKKFYYLLNEDNEKKIRIDPEKVYLHIKHSWANIELDFNSNPSYWNFFVSHPNDKIFKHVADQLKDKIRVIDISTIVYKGNVANYTKRFGIKSLENPLFQKSHYYGSGNDVMDQVLFTGLNTLLF